MENRRKYTKEAAENDESSLDIGHFKESEAVERDRYQINVFAACLTLIKSLGWIYAVPAALAFKIIFSLIFRNISASSYKAFSPFVNSVSLCIFFSIMIYSTVQNIIRKLKKDPYYKLSEAIANAGNNDGLPTKSTERKAIDPGIPNSLRKILPKGFVFGQSKNSNYYACKPTERDGHIGVFGGPGTGKTRSVAKPTIDAWQGPIFAIDIKGTLSDAMSPIKKCGLKVFNPLDEDAYGYDPFYAVDIANDDYAAIEQIVSALIPYPAEIKGDTFWTDAPRRILTGELLYLYHRGYSFVQAMQILQKTSHVQTINMIFRSDEEKAKLCIANFAGKDNNTMDSIAMTLGSCIGAFSTDSGIISAFSRKKIVTPEDLESGHSVFLTIPEDRLDAWKPMLNLMLSQFLKAFERRAEYPEKRILFLIDEFPRLGRIDGIESALATLRSRGITIALILQSMAQLEKIYGEKSRRIIMDSFGFIEILGVKDAQTQKYFSDVTGTYEKKVAGTSSNAHTGLFGIENGYGSMGMSYSLQEKRIIKPEDFSNLGNDAVILGEEGYFRVKKIGY